MTVKSHAGWLPAEGDGAEAAETRIGSGAAQALTSGEARLISGRARIDAEGMERPAGEPDGASLSSGRVLGEEEIAAGGFFQERVIEMTETREEAVVEKDVVVREEVVLRKNIGERTETITDSVRRTEVEVEEMRAPSEAPPTE